MEDALLVVKRMMEYLVVYTPNIPTYVLQPVGMFRRQAERWRRFLLSFVFVPSHCRVRRTLHFLTRTLRPARDPTVTPLIVIVIFFNCPDRKSVV